MELEFEVPTWIQVYEMLLKLATRIRKDKFAANTIVGISRGGWPPARILSDLLENPNLANVKAEFYVGVAETKGEPILTQPVSVPVEGEKVLIVDEVADTGLSLKMIKEHIIGKGAKEARTLTVYYKPWSVIRPDYYAKETEKWIVFPWEVKETIRKLYKRFKKDKSRLSIETAKLVKEGVVAELVKRFSEEMIEEEDC